MRAWILLLILLTAAPAFAGPGVRSVMRSATVYDPPMSFAINGISGISSGGVTDTGTATISTGRGYISAYADCTGSAGVPTHVYLVVNGSTRDELFCDEILTPNSDTLRYFVEAGDYSVRVYGTTISDVFNANTFMKPTPP